MERKVTFYKKPRTDTKQSNLFQSNIPEVDEVDAPSAANDLVLRKSFPECWLWNSYSAQGFVMIQLFFIDKY